MSSASQIEREVEASRANLEDTVEALKDKMSVGQVFEEASRYLGDNGGAEIMNNLIAQARANPIPLALVGVGLVWLMSGRGTPRVSSIRSRGGYDRDYESLDEDEYRRTFAEGSVYTGASHPDYSRNSGGRDTWSGRGEHSGSGGMFDSMGRRIHDARDAVSGAASTIGDAAGSVASGVSSAASAVASGIGAVASGLGSAASGVGSAASYAGRAAYSAAETVAGGARSGADVAWRGGSSVYRGASDVGYDAYRGASRYGRGAQRTFSEVLESEPLIIGALGLAVGAAIGALLPGTETEDRYFGETRDRLRDDAESFARDKFEQGKAVVGEIYETAKDEAEARGLTTAGQGSIVEKVGEVARATLDKAKDSAAEKGLALGGSESSAGSTKSSSGSTGFSAGSASSSAGSAASSTGSTGSTASKAGKGPTKTTT